EPSGDSVIQIAYGPGLPDVEQSKEKERRDEPENAVAVAEHERRCEKAHDLVEIDRWMIVSRDFARARAADEYPADEERRDDREPERERQVEQEPRGHERDHGAGRARCTRREARAEAGREPLHRIAQ